MKVATFNIQNLFHRHTDLVVENHKNKIELWVQELDSLLSKYQKKEKDLARMRELADYIDFERSGLKGIYVQRALHGNKKNEEDKLIFDIYSKTIVEEAKWNSEPIPFESVKNKIRVIRENDPDILLLQEVESRNALLRFNEMAFANSKESGYSSIIHLDGNARKGQGMGLLTKDGFRIRSIQSHSSEKDCDGSHLFSNDLQAYQIESPLGETVHILNVQLSSNPNDLVLLEKRKRQVSLVAEVYRTLASKRNEPVLVTGTLNAPKYSESIAPLFDQDVIDITQHGSFEVEPDLENDSGYYRMGGYKKGVNMIQKDYLLTSSTAKERIEKCGMDRKGVWPEKRPVWKVYETLKNEKDAASEHPLLWAKLNLGTSKNILKKTA